MKMPAITVLMPAYNAAAYIREAIDSILAQTVADFEFLIIDDGSTDGTVAVVESVGDPRIRLVRNPRNMGVVATLNRGIELSRGQFIARMDADDISWPRRFEWQLRLMDRAPDVVACSGWSVDFCAGGCDKYNFREADHDTLLGRMFFEPPLSHPASFIRTSTLKESGIRYDSRYLHCEDYRFWYDLSKVGRLSNVQKMILRYRVIDTSVTKRYGDQQAATARGLRREIVDDFFRRRGIELQLPEVITGDYFEQFERLYQVSLPEEFGDRRTWARQLNFLKYSVYMSLDRYDLSSLVRYLASGDYLRYGIRGKRAAKIILKHLFPHKKQAFL